jgi:hypothetical protein
MTENQRSTETKRPTVELEHLVTLEMAAVELYRDARGEIAARCRDDLAQHLDAGRGCLVVGRRRRHTLERDESHVSAAQMRGLVHEVAHGAWTQAVRWTEPEANTPTSARQAVELHYREAALALPGRLGRQFEPHRAEIEARAIARLVHAGVEALVPYFRAHQRLEDRNAWVLLVSERTAVGADGATRACCAVIAVPEGGPRAQEVPWVADAADPDAPEIEPPLGIHGGEFAIAFDYVSVPLERDGGDQAQQQALAALWLDIVPLAVGEVARRIANSTRQRREKAQLHVVLDAAGIDARGAIEPLRRRLEELGEALSRFSGKQLALRRLDCMQADEHDGLPGAADLAARVLGRSDWQAAEIAHLCATGALERFPRSPRGLAEVYDLWEELGDGDRLGVVYEIIDDISPSGVEQFGSLHERAVSEVVGKLQAKEWSGLWARVVDAMQNRPDRKDAVHLVLRPLTPVAIRKLRNLRTDTESMAQIVNMRLYAANQCGDVGLAGELEHLWGEFFGPRHTPSEHSRALHLALRANGRMNRFAYGEALQLLATADTATPPLELTGSALQCHAFERDRDAFLRTLDRHRAALSRAHAPLDADLRLGCYLAHEAIDRGAPAEAFAALRDAAAHGHGTALERLLAACGSNPFFRVAVLKAVWAARALGVDAPPGADRAAADMGSEWLGAAHPSEALAFWSALVLRQRALANPATRRDDTRRAQALGHHVAAIAQGPNARTDAAGARLAAYWTVLADLKLAHADGLPAFRDDVHSRSRTTTQVWLTEAAAAPDPRRQHIFAAAPASFDALAPLTFNAL